MSEQREVLDRLQAVLERTVLRGSTREVRPDVPLGQEGVGLDSLALVQFLTGVEQELSAEVPLEIWADIGRLSLNDCTVALVEAP